MNKAPHISTSIHALSLLGGRLCLDFTNTVEPRVGKHTHNFLTSYADLVQWCRHANMLKEDEAQKLLTQALDHPTEAKKVFERAISLREIIYRIFSAVARKTLPQSTDLDTLKMEYAEAIKHAQIVSTIDGFRWDWTGEVLTLEGALWPVIYSALELLTSQEVLQRVKECPGIGDCGWLFLDTSKNGSRQWCSMEGCGSRAKMRRQYARKRNEHLRSTNE